MASGGLIFTLLRQSLLLPSFVSDQLVKEHHSLYARLALNTEKSPLVDAGEPDFFTGWWIGLFCLLYFFARNLNRGRFIR